jgi:flagellar motor switch protein FliM
MEASAGHIHFGGALQLPPVRLPAAAVRDLQPGMVIPLGLPANTLPEWRVGGQVLLRAEAVRQGLHRAARIDSRIERTEP